MMSEKTIGLLLIGGLAGAVLFSQASSNAGVPDGSSASAAPPSDPLATASELETVAFLPAAISSLGI